MRAKGKVGSRYSWSRGSIVHDRVLAYVALIRLLRRLRGGHLSRWSIANSVILDLVDEVIDDKQFVLRLKR